MGAGGIRGALRQRTVRTLVDRGSVVLVGEMGVGKSHLLSEVVGELRAVGRVCTSIRANPAAATIAFGALAAFTEGAEHGDRLEMLRSTVASIRAIGQGGDHVLAIDDAPLLDDQSIAVLHHLCVADGIPLLATVRSSDEQRDTLTTLWRDAGAERLPVEPLDREESTLLAAARLGDAPDAVRVRSIVDRSAGNPLFIGELARAELDGAAGGLTAHLRDVVGARISRLDASRRHQLALIVVADPLDTDLDAADAAAIGELETAGLVTTEDDHDDVLARPAHPLYGEIVRDGLSALQRKEVARELTAAMRDRDVVRRGDALRLAGWLRACGDEPSAELAVPAALEAISVLDVELANELVNIAIAVDPDFEALFAAGEIARLTGDVERALTWFERAFEIAERDDQIRPVAIAMGQLHGFFRAEPDDAVRVLGDAVERLSDPVQRLELEMERSMFAAMLGRYEDVLVSARRVLAHPDCDDAARWTACTNVSWAEAQLIDLREIDDHLDVAMGIADAEPANQVGQLDLLHAVRVNAMMERGRFDDAMSSASAFLDPDGPDAGAPAGLTTFSVAQVEWMQGNADEARLRTEHAREQLQAFDAYNAFPFVCGAAAVMAVTSGDAAGARTLVDTAVERDGGGAMWDRIWLGRARAWLALEQGDVDGAVDLIVEAADVGIETTHLGWALLALHDSLAWGAVERVVGRLDGLRRRMHDAPFFQQMADDARALADGDVEAAAAGIDRLRSFGALWQAGVESAALAQWCSHRGHEVDARRHATAARLWMSVSCPQVELVEEVALSSARLSVVEAAVAGLTSREIAEQRYLSIRTVDNHLGAAYSALDVSGRAELVELFAPMRVSPEAVSSKPGQPTPAKMESQ